MTAFWIRLQITFRRLAKVATFIAKLQAKHEIQTYEKVSYEVRNRHFCQTLVSGSGFAFRLVISTHFLFSIFRE